MRHLRTRSKIGVTVAAVAAVAFGTLGSLPPTAAADPEPTGGAQGTSAAQEGQSAAVSGEAPKVFKTYQLKGGYVAGGISLRNRGFGKIKISGIPKGAKVKGAYLFWSVLHNSETAALKKGKFAGKKIKGTKVGSGDSPCWTQSSKGYAYRANVTKKVKGNGTYALKGFASGNKNAVDPWTESKVPQAEGASLVVVYKKARYPLTKVILASGYAEVSTGDTASRTLPFGFAATNPVGAVKTTFIGGDGQSADEPASTVNGIAVPEADWDGTDGPTPAYSQGNLWDTDTANLPNYVKPGNTSATINVSGGSDCLAWVGQAFSIGVNGNVDTDGDALKDGWEANGYDHNGDNVIDVNLPGMGASVVRKDLFVEMDYMNAGFLPTDADLARIVSVYANAPQANNPNGQKGIKLHLDAGAVRPAYNLGGGNAVPFDADLNPVVPEFNAIKAGNFANARSRTFYYMIWGNGYNGGSSSGNAFNIPNDSFLVTLGLWPSDGTPDQRVGTFIHEFGHALGHTHGGNDHGNYKPNYLSVMNYSFQLDGVPRANGTRYFGYSSFKLPSLNENNLNERKGLRSKKAKAWDTQWVCPNFSFAAGGPAHKNLDWTCNGSLSTSVGADINGDGTRNTLGTANNWGNMIYGGGAVGGVDALMASESMADLEDELTLETYQEHLAHLSD